MFFLGERVCFVGLRVYVIFYIVFGLFPFCFVDFVQERCKAREVRGGDVLGSSKGFQYIAVLAFSKNERTL